MAAMVVAAAAVLMVWAGIRLAVAGVADMAYQLLLPRSPYWKAVRFLPMVAMAKMETDIIRLVVAVVAAAALALLPMSLLRAVALLPTAEVVALLGRMLPLVLTAKLEELPSNNWGRYK